MRTETLHTVFHNNTVPCPIWHHRRMIYKAFVQKVRQGSFLFLLLLAFVSRRLSFKLGSCMLFRISMFILLLRLDQIL